MKSLAYLGRGILIFLALVIALSLMPSASANWDRPSVTLKPGENVVVEYINTENLAKNFAVENISAPDALLPFVVVSPASIAAFDNENIYITFVTVPQSVSSGIAKDTYSIKITGLVVNLDMTENNPSQENIDNITAELTALRAELNSLRTSISIYLDNLQLQNTRQDQCIDNLTQCLTALQDNIARINIRLDALFAKVYENSPYDNYDVEIKNMYDWIQGANDNVWAQVNGLLTVQDEKLLAMQEVVDENRTYAYAGIGVAIGVGFFMLLIMRFKKSAPSPAAPKKPVDPDAPKPSAPLEKMSSM